MFVDLFLALLDNPEDERLFAIIFEQHVNELYRIAFMKLKDAHDAEDAVQATFIALAKNFHKIRGLYDSEYPKFKGYLVTILENKIIDILRYKNRHHAENYDVLQVSSLKDDPEDPGLYEILNQLNEKARIVLLLRFDLGFTPKEIAKQMNVSVWTVYKWIEQAREALAEILEIEEDEER